MGLQSRSCGSGARAELVTERRVRIAAGIKYPLHRSAPLQTSPVPHCVPAVALGAREKYDAVAKTQATSVCISCSLHGMRLKRNR